MREINFRAWDGKEMLYNGMIVKPSHLNEYSNKCFTPIKIYHNKVELWFLETQVKNAGQEAFDHPTYLNAVAYMQYTGVYDCMSKEVCEGDILNYTSPTKYSNGTNEFRAPVVYNKGAFTIDIHKSTLLRTNGDYIGWLQAHGFEGAKSFCSIATGETFEIIGNIYQHPHLLALHNNLD